uniref:Putative reverse transcriptase, RNA-dependent DNA polymerase n=1 Tax=Tanacetum cinerariifolium TaxID=118510 RepID=A0A6L2NEC1_TANCI|nr:putative reverse transcriptase, RNA-dependent DNA polymerase [Tanacetum cinerariifolium]
MSIMPYGSKYKTARELWAAILKTFGGNEATKKNLLKQQYGNFKAEGSETLEQTFNRLQVIVGQLQFIDIEIEQDDLNQKFLTSLAPEWIMHTIVWRNRSDLDTMSLDDLYNHLKNMALLSMRADKFWKKTWKKISIHGSDVAGFDKSKIECFNCHKMGHFAREYRAPRNQDRGRRNNYRLGSKSEEQAPKALMAIDGVGWDWIYIENDEEDHALVADEVAPTEFALMANTSAEIKKLETLKEEKEGVDGKLAGLLKDSKDLDNLIESQRNFPPINRKFSTGSRNFPTANRKFPTASRKFPTGSTKCSTADIGMKGKAIKPSACNISYLFDFEPFDGGYVSFVQGGCKITGKGTIKTDNLGKFEEKGDEGYFIGYSMSSKAFRVFNKRTRRVEENLHVEFLENKAIEKGVGPNWLFDIDSLTKSMNYVPVDAGIISTNISGTKDATSQEVKKNVSSLRYIALPNWAHDALLEFSSSKPQDHCSTEVLEGSGNPNPTASTSNPLADLMETLTVETPIPTASSPVPTAYSSDSQEPSNILGGTTNSDESNGVEADISNMEIAITASPTPTLIIHKDHPKGQIIGPLDTPIQTKNKSKEMDVKSAFLYVTIDEEVYVMQPPGFQDPEFPAKVYKVEKAMYGLHQALRAWHQVTPKECHLHAVKRIFRYLKSHPKLGLWYPKESPFDLVAYSDSDYGGATQDHKSTTGGYQFFGKRLISWQCKKQTIIATSTTKCKLFPLLGKLSTVRVFLGFGLTLAGTSKYWGVLRILMISLRLIPLVRKGYVTMKAYSEQRTHEFIHVYLAFASVTVSESSLRRNLKLQDEDGISSLHDTELFENLTLMGYNISPNQKFTFQKGQFSHQWKYLIRTIMKCISPKSTRFNEFSSNIATALVCLATNRTYNFSKMIFDGLVKNVNNKISKLLMYPRFLTICLRMSQFAQITHTHTYVVPFHTRKRFTTLRVNNPSFSGRIVPFFNTMLVQQGEGSGTPTEPHHTPSPEAQSPSHTTHTSPTLPPVTTTSIPIGIPSDTPIVRQYTRRTRIAQSFVPPTVADEPASPLRDVSQGEACPTDSGFIADQDRATIDKSSTLPYDSAPRVTSPVADEGSMQEIILELTALCTSLQRQLLELTAKFQAQEVEINRLKERVKMLEDKEGMAATRSKDDAPIKRRTTVLASGVVDVPTGSGSIPTASTEEQVLTGSDVVPTAILVFATATVRIRRSTRKREREDQRRSEQIARDAEIIRIHAKEELQIMIDGLDRNNETIAKYLQEYHQFALKLPFERRIELITDLKTLEEVPEEAMSHEEVLEEKVKEMMLLVPIEEVYVEALQVKHPIIDWKRLVKETLSNRPPTSAKEMELWVELSRQYEPDHEDQLWTHTQNFMHAPME